ncbi:TonB-dependent siderophore receptor [Chishuiella changwenlii]|uniref:TonB-dependent siderophore receptor n=1 Tax=Chishuiella changwenlii TaxID=1434701 RepID=UPI002FDB3588
MKKRSGLIGFSLCCLLASTVVVKAQTLDYSTKVVKIDNQKISVREIIKLYEKETNTKLVFVDSSVVNLNKTVEIDPADYTLTELLNIILDDNSIKKITSRGNTFIIQTEKDEVSAIQNDVENLQTVEITGRTEKGYKNSSTFSGTKTNTDLMDIPQSINYVTKETLNDQGAFKTSDAVKNISGVNQASYNNNDFVLRGFRASNTLVNGQRISTRGWAQNLTPYVERIEVIKGPASALFANTDPGGTINTITKKPLKETRNSVNFSTGSFNTYRLTGDFTGAMNEDKTLLYRLNLAYQNAGSFRILQDQKALVIAPSFSFIPNKKTSVNFDFVYQNTDGRLDRGQPIFGATQGTDLYSVPISFAIGKENDYQKEANIFTTLSLQHKFNDNISFNASYLRSMYDEDLLEHRTSNSFATDVEGNTIPTLMGMNTIRRLRKNYIDNFSGYFTFDYNTGEVKHKTLVGYDHIQEIFPKGNSTYNASGFLSADGTKVISKYDPKHPELYMIKDGMPVPNVPYFNLENPDYSISEISNYINISKEETPSKYFLNGIYIQQQISWRRWKALLGLRQEYYTDVQGYTTNKQRNIQQKALTPRVGLVFEPSKNTSLYATYNQGYQPQSAGTIGDPATFGGPFDPLKSKMVEAGAKFEFFHKRLSLTTSAYYIEQNNILINALDPSNPDLLRQIGQQQAKGVELDINGQILHNLSVVAAFSYNDAKITESDNAEEIGQTMANAPKSQGNVWVRYNFKTGSFLDGIGIAGGMNYATKRLTNETILELPGYVVSNAAIFYQQNHFRLALNVNNVFDKTYWVGGFSYARLFPGTPRNYMISVGYSF